MAVAMFWYGHSRSAGDEPCIRYYNKDANEALDFFDSFSPKIELSNVKQSPNDQVNIFKLFVFLTNSLKPRYIQFNVLKEQQMLTFEKLERVNS